MLRILGKAISINARTVPWSCAELDIPFVQENRGSGLQSTAHPGCLALNPNAMVPVDTAWAPVDAMGPVQKDGRFRQWDGPPPLDFWNHS